MVSLPAHLSQFTFLSLAMKAAAWQNTHKGTCTQAKRTTVQGAIWLHGYTTAAAPAIEKVRSCIVSSAMSGRVWELMQWSTQQMVNGTQQALVDGTHIFGKFVVALHTTHAHTHAHNTHVHTHTDSQPGA